ncbi:MAG: AzlC family ABC transporter permease [Oscillospiraceae bacterium]
MKSLRFALGQIVPLLPSYVFVGIASGVLLNEAGYSPLWAFVTGLLIYAGSMQLVMITLLASGVPLPMIALMTLFINGRHIFYGLGFLERFRKIGGWKYPYLALTMTDETYSVLCSLDCPPGVEEEQVDFWVLFLCHMLWVIVSTAGALAGNFLPFDLTGIDFSATAFFVVVVVNQWRQFSSHLPALIGFFSAVGFYFLLGADRFILPALSMSLLVMVVLRERIAGKMGGSADVT